MDRRLFLKLLSKRFYPILREEGFVGAGSTLRRVAGPLIHVFNVQGSGHGRECFLNLGTHLEFLPPEGGQQVSSELLQESHCAFRKRIDPPAGTTFGWAYGTSAESAEQTVDFIISEWHSQGRAFFKKYANYPGSFVELLVGTEPTAIHARTNLHFARIAAHLNQTKEARRFAQAGLASAGERATSLRYDLSVILRACYELCPCHANLYG